jgi:hypothetical protein
MSQFFEQSCMRNGNLFFVARCSYSDLKKNCQVCYTHFYWHIKAKKLFLDAYKTTTKERIWRIIRGSNRTCQIATKTRGRVFPNPGKMIHIG